MIADGIKCYLKRNLVFLEENIFSKILWMYSESTFLFLVIGFGIGSSMPPIGSISYLKFFLIGFLFANVLRIVFLNIGIGFFKKINSKNYINQMKILPFKYKEIIKGELIWSSVKGFMASIILILIGLLMGIYDLNKLVIIVTLVFVSSYIFSAMSLVICLTSKNSKSIFVWQYLFIMPMFFFSGTFFPIETYPKLLYYIIMSLPLTHMIILGRVIIEGSWHSTAIVSAMALLMYSFIFSFLISKYSNADFKVEA